MVTSPTTRIRFNGLSILRAANRKGAFPIRRFFSWRGIIRRRPCAWRSKASRDIRRDRACASVGRVGGSLNGNGFCVTARDLDQRRAVFDFEGRAATLRDFRPACALRIGARLCLCRTQNNKCDAASFGAQTTRRFIGAACGAAFKSSAKSSAIVRQNSPLTQSNVWDRCGTEHDKQKDSMGRIENWRKPLPPAFSSQSQ